MDSQYKLSKQEVIDNYQSELSFLKSLGYLNNDENIVGIVEGNGVSEYLKKLYGYDFVYFEKKIMNSNCFNNEQAWKSLIDTKGDYIKSFEQCLPDQFAIFNELKVKNPDSSNEQILEAMYFDTPIYNQVDFCSNFLRRKEIFKAQNEVLKSKYSLTDEESNFIALVKASGNIEDSVFILDESKIINPIKNKLIEIGLDFSKVDGIENAIRNAKTLDETVAYVKIVNQGGEELLFKINELLSSVNYENKLNLLEKANWDPYLAAIYNDQKSVDIYEKYKGNHSTVFLFYIGEALKENKVEVSVDEFIANCQKVMDEAKNFGVDPQDTFAITNVTMYNYDVATLIKLINVDAFNDYAKSVFLSKGYSQDVIEASYSFINFENDLECQEDIMQVIKEGKLDVLSQIRENIGESSLMFSCKRICNLCREHNYDMYKVLYDYEEFPPKFRGQLDSMELYEKLVSFREGGGSDNYDILEKNGFDVKKALAELENS